MMTSKEKEAKKQALRREFERRKREEILNAPVIKRGLMFYLVVILGLGFIGAAILQTLNNGGETAQQRRARNLVCERSLSALAEALGRYKFHCGVYPSAEQGLVALALKESPHKGWIGPYIKGIRRDPWKREYVYEPGTNSVVLLSLGPDGVRGTADDIYPDPALFEKPFRDTSWTNDWAHYTQRGIIIVPSKNK